MNLPLFLLCGSLMIASGADQNVRTLQLGAKAPDFGLPGVDGQNRKLKDFATAKVLVIVFTCNHCPTAQYYEPRLKQFVSDYRDKGVALVAIMPNDPKSVRLDELGWTDLSDSFAEMKIRARAITSLISRISTTVTRNRCPVRMGLWRHRMCSSSTTNGNSDMPELSTTPSACSM